MVWMDGGYVASVDVKELYQPTDWNYLLGCTMKAHYGSVQVQILQYQMSVVCTNNYHVVVVTELI